MNVQVWNVGHGEAMRIDLNDQFSLVRDFGTCSPWRPGGRRYSVKEIAENHTPEPLFRGAHCDAMLSHPHRDHFSGFALIQKFLNQGHHTSRFERGFIHRLDFATEQSLGFQLVIACVYLYVAAKSWSRSRKVAKQWLVAAPIMYDVCDHLHAVQFADQIPFGSSVVDVLWPPFSDNHYLAELTEFLRRLNEELGRHLGDRVDLGDLLGVIRTLAAIEAKYYGSSLRNAVVLEGDRAGADDLKDIEAELARLRLLRAELPDEIVAKALTGFNSSVDNLGLVISLESGSAYLADLEDKALAVMCCLNCMQFGGPARYVGRSSPLMKSSHHGTRYSDRLPCFFGSAHEVLHCCGPANARFGGPNSAWTALHPNTVWFTEDHPRSAPLPLMVKQVFPQPFRALNT